MDRYHNLWEIYHSDGKDRAYLALSPELFPLTYCQTMALIHSQFVFWFWYNEKQSGTRLPWVLKYSQAISSTILNIYIRVSIDSDMVAYHALEVSCRTARDTRASGRIKSIIQAGKSGQVGVLDNAPRLRGLGLYMAISTRPTHDILPMNDWPKMQCAGISGSL